VSGGRYPGGKRFAFSIVDDTDNATVASVGPVYALLAELGLRSTKTVWVYPPRDRFTGESLADPHYVAWLRELQAKGFEIALHNVGSGAFTRQEILAGLDRFRDLLGGDPRMQVNHVSNPDNLYWRAERRFRPPIRWAYALVRKAQNLLSGRAPTMSAGEDPASPHYWGDACRERIRYVRNLTFRSLDTLAVDPRMPYHDPRKPLVQRWFSSADGNTADHLVDLLSPANLDRLEANGGATIIYTHTTNGFMRDGAVRADVVACLRDVARRSVWSVPASDLLDHLAARPETESVSEGYLRGLERRWLWERIGNYIRYRR
jgi:hypothetical protein